MELMDINKLEFFFGTYDNYHVAKYGSFIFNDEGERIANEWVIYINQGDDSIIFVQIYNYIIGIDENFIMENMEFDSIGISDIVKVVDHYNDIIKKKHRNKQVNIIF